MTEVTYLLIFIGMGKIKQAHKSPLLAAFFSFLIWGGGQVYNRQFGLGLAYFIFMGDVIALASILLLFQFHFNQIAVPFLFEPVSTSLIYRIGGMFVLIFWIFNILQAFFTAFRLNRPHRSS